MPLNLRERFGPKGAQPQSSLTGDFRFVPAEYTSLREYRIEHEEVNVLEKPLAVDRLYFLTYDSDSLQIEFALCLEGAAAATELLFRRAEAFQREPDVEAVRDLALAHGIGDVGLAWSWDKMERHGVAGFVRYNVLVFLQGAQRVAAPAGARTQDVALTSTPAGAGPSQTAEPSFEFAERETALRVAPGGRVDLGLPLRPGKNHFFIASGGSVNRDPGRSRRNHCFRAARPEQGASTRDHAGCRRRPAAGPPDAHRRVTME